MKKTIFIALAMLLMLAGCKEKDEVRKIGNGEMTCTPSTMTLKVGETQSFTFNTSHNDIIWTVMPYYDGSTGDVSIAHPDGTNKIEVTGETAGRIQVVARYEESDVASQIIGGVDVKVEK